MVQLCWLVRKDFGWWEEGGEGVMCRVEEEDLAAHLVAHHLPDRLG